MKALVIVTAHFGYDGISNVAKSYYLYQDHKRVQMDLVTINEIPESLRSEIEHNGDKSYVLRERNKNPLSYVFALSRIVKKGKYDVVHIHGNSNTMFVELWAAMLGGCKTRIPHSHNTKCDHPIINKILRPLFKIAYTDAFACGVEAGEWLFKKNEATIIPNGVDLQRYTLDESFRVQYKNELGLDGRLVIGHVGRFSVQKNHKKLLSIFAAIQKKKPMVSLLMWGEGELMEDAKEQAQQIGGDIRFMGTSDHIEKCLHAVDIIVFPSVYEGLPLFLVEAQAMGMPCLLSDTVSPMTKITDSVAYEPFGASDEEWADAAIKMMEGQNVIENSKKAHELIREAGYDIRVNAGKLIDKYEQLKAKNNA